MHRIITKSNMMTTQQMWAVHLLDENRLRRNKSFQRRPDWSSSNSSSRTSTFYKTEHMRRLFTHFKQNTYSLDQTKSFIPVNLCGRYSSIGLLTRSYVSSDQKLNPCL